MIEHGRIGYLVTNKIRDEILNETTTFCEECGSREICPEDECVLYRIEKIVENWGDENDE